MTNTMGWVLTCVALILVIEGLMPTLSPVRWRLLLERLAKLPDRSIRMLGLVSMVLGASVMAITHQLFWV